MDRRLEIVHRARLRAALLALVLGAALSAATLAQNRASKLLTLKLLPSNTGLLAVLKADGPLEHRVVEEQNPGQRLVLDVLGVANPLRHYYPPETHPLLERILMYEYPEATNPNKRGPLARIVFELKRAVSYRIAPQANELHVEFLSLEAPPELHEPVENGAAGAQAESTQSTPESSLPAKLSIEPPDVPPSLFFKPALASMDYRVGPEDVLEVRVFELDQLNRTVRVSGDGYVELPLVGRIRANGLTADGVATEVAARLRDRYVQNPQVTIFIKEFNSQKVSLLGAVSTPSSYPLTGQKRLLQILAEAGSLSPDAGRTLYVFRQTPDGRSARLTVPLNELLLEGDPRWNIVLRPGDVISIPPERAIAVSVLGAVNSPGVHKLPVGDEATLLKAIALAGGLNERASKRGVQITRRDDEGTETIVKVNLGDILSGKKPDVVLREGDVVVVNESFF